jgi:hypothetical protein
MVMVLRTKKPHKTGERYAVRGVEEMKGRRGEKNPPPTPRLGPGQALRGGDPSDATFAKISL